MRAKLPTDRPSVSSDDGQPHHPGHNATVTHPENVYLKIVDPAMIARARIIRRLAEGQDVPMSAMLSLPATPIDWCGLANALANTVDVSARPALIDRWADSLSRTPPESVERFRHAYKLAETETLDDQDDDTERPRLKILGALELARTDFPMRWLIKRILVENQPCVVGAPKKGMKTSTMVDLIVSLAAADPFLGEFAVPDPVPVLLLSGESGGFVIKDTIRRVCQSKGIDDMGILEGNLFVAFELPQLSVPEQVAELAELIRERRIEVVVIDPLYLCLLSGTTNGRRLDPSNMFDMGPLLMDISRACLDAGATPVLVHHFRMRIENPHDLPEMDNMAFAGIQEFARQWILLGRRRKFEPGSGRHELWLTVGGSAGHSGEWGLDVAEGVMDDDFQGRAWDVSVRPASEIRNEKVEKTQAKVINRQVEQSRMKDQAKGVCVLQDSENALAKLREMGKATVGCWRQALGWSGDRIAFCRSRLEEQARIRPATVTVRSGKKGTREVPGWEPVEVTLFPDRRAVLPGDPNESY